MRLKYLGAVPIVFVHDGLPEWQPGAEMDVADGLAKKLLAERPGQFEPVRDVELEPVKPEPAATKGKADKAAVTAEPEA